ncbi:hypothetical protein EON63_25015 [archaeon]|nr:MAG: hypothetical protein EON63_25015 [archaeon]
MICILPALSLSAHILISPYTRMHVCFLVCIARTLYVHMHTYTHSTHSISHIQTCMGCVLYVYVCDFGLSLFFFFFKMFCFVLCKCML